MNNQITAVSFSAAPLHKEAYELSIHFLNEDKVQFSRSFTFKHSAGSNNLVLDIFTKNGSCDNLQFNKRELEEALNAKNLLQSYDTAPVKLAVFDLKHSQSKYLDGEAIHQGEKKVCEAFANGSSSKTLTKLRSQLPIDFILAEASLKHDILKLLSDREISFLNSEEGTVSFCMFAEYFMTGLKLGDAPRELDPTKYFLPVKNKTYAPCISSTTFYPEQYQTIYSVDSAFANTLRKQYVVEGSNPVQKITTLTVGKRV
jgi:hypothetical protein